MKIQIKSKGALCLSSARPACAYLPPQVLASSGQGALIEVAGVVATGLPSPLPWEMSGYWWALPSHTPLVAAAYATY